MQSISDAYLDYNYLSQSLHDIEKEQVNRENIYEKIMEKEENAINLMNRIAEEKQNNVQKTNEFLNLTLQEMYARSIVKWLLIYNDIVNLKNYNLKEVLYDGDRKIYFGIFLIIISVFFFFAEISN